MVESYILQFSKGDDDDTDFRWNFHFMENVVGGGYQ